MAERLGITESAFRMRYYRGKVKKPKLIIRGQKTIFVREKL
jgi:hypothetical protein